MENGAVILMGTNSVANNLSASGALLYSPYPRTFKYADTRSHHLLTTLSLLLIITLFLIFSCQYELHLRARVVLYEQYRTSPLSSNELHKQLHWLPIEWRIWFKLATLTFKALHTGRLPYLSDLLQHHGPTRSLCSSSSHQLSFPITIYLLDLVLFVFLLPESGIHYLSASANLRHFLLSDVI